MKKMLSAFLSAAMCLTSFSSIPVTAADLSSPSLTVAEANDVLTTTTTTVPQTFTTTAGPDQNEITTTVATTTEDPDSYVMKKLRITVAAVDIDTGEYVGGIDAALGHEDVFSRKIIQNFTVGCEPYTTETVDVKVRKGSYERYYVGTGRAPLGYEFADEKSLIQYFNVDENYSGIQKCVFYVRKLAKNASPEMSLNREGKFFFDVYISSNVSSDPVENIDMKLVKIMEKGGEETVIERWNTSDDPHHYTNIYEYDPNAYCYMITSEKLPDFYTQGTDLDHVQLMYEFPLNEGSMYKAYLTLNKWEKAMPTYPIKTDCDIKVDVKDISSNTFVEGLDITVEKLDADGNVTGELAHFKKGDDYKFTLPCEFEDKMSAEKVKITINDMPDGYDYSSPYAGNNIKTLNGYNYAMYYAQDNLDDISMTVFIQNPNVTTDPYQIIHTGTTTHNLNPVSTTTTIAVPAMSTTLPTTDEEEETIYGEIVADYFGNLRVYTGEELDLSDLPLKLMTYADPEGKYSTNVYYDCHFKAGSGLYSDLYTVDTSEVDFTKPGVYNIYITSKKGAKGVFATKNNHLSTGYSYPDGDIKVNLIGKRKSTYTVEVFDKSKTENTPLYFRVYYDAMKMYEQDGTIPELIGAEASSVKYEIADPTVAKITDSSYNYVEIIGLKEGKTTITAYASDGRTATENIEVFKRPAETTTILTATTTGNLTVISTTTTTVDPLHNGTTVTKWWYDYEQSRTATANLTTTTAFGTTVQYNTTLPRTTTTTVPTISDIRGDANCDGRLNMGDAVLIMQSIANPDKYKLSEKGKKNADIDGNGDGITSMDALAIQKILLKLT